MLVYDAIFFLGPLAILVVFSLANTVGFGQVSYALSSVNFRQLWDPLYLDIFKTTLAMAALGTVLTLLVGYPMAYWMARCLSGGKSLALILVIIPFLTSFLIRTYAWFIILDPQGFLVSFVHDLGFGGWRPLYTTQAIGIGLVYNYMPLLILPVYASLERMDWSLVDAALDLGSSPFRAFRQVTLPLTLPGLVTGVLLVFIPMTGEYVDSLAARRRQARVRRQRRGRPVPGRAELAIRSGHGDCAAARAQPLPDRLPRVRDEGAAVRCLAGPALVDIAC